MTLGGLLAALRSRWLVVGVLIAIGATAGAAVALSAPKSFVATSTIVLRWVGPGSDAAEADSIRYATSRAPTYALLAQSPEVLADAAQRAGFDQGYGELRRRVSTDVPLGSQLIKIHARSAQAKEAAALANAVSEAMVFEIPRQEVRSPFEPGMIDAVVAVEAFPPLAASTPRLSMYVAVGTAGGMLCGTALALLFTYLEARKSSRRANGPLQTVPPMRGLSRAHVVWAMLIAATIPWRSDTFYEGGADPVVVAKAIISLGATALSAWVFFSASDRFPVPAAPVLLLFVYFGVTTIGGLANDDLVPAIVVAARVMILMVAVCLLAAAYGVRFALQSLMHVLAVVIVMSAVSGLTTFSGRLRGVIPPLDPNALAFVAGAVAIWLLSKVIAGRDSMWDLASLVGCLVVVLLTGSRTGLAAMVLAFLAMMFRATALKVRTLILVALAVPGITFMVLGTDLLSELFMRGGGQQVATLSNRTIAWNAALNLDRDTWQTWFGQGLAQKKIPVPGQYWDTQLLDSSWISALIQGGVIGSVLVMVLAVATLFYSAFSPRSTGSVGLGLVVLCLLAGFLESGLFDGSLLFVVFLLASLGAFSSHDATIKIDRRAVTGSSLNQGARTQPISG